MRNKFQIEQDGQYLGFTCRNSKFETNISKGYPHFANQDYLGSAIRGPLYNEGGLSLWLEHVVNRMDRSECFWFMWYRDGTPLINMSGVLGKSDIAELISNFQAISLD